jgi:hypothetical protein
MYACIGAMTFMIARPIPGAYLASLKVRVPGIGIGAVKRDLKKNDYATATYC